MFLLFLPSILDPIGSDIERVGEEVDPENWL